MYSSVDQGGGSIDGDGVLMVVEVLMCMWVLMRWGCRWVGGVYSSVDWSGGV